MLIDLHHKSKKPENEKVVYPDDDVDDRYNGNESTNDFRNC